MAKQPTSQMMETRTQQRSQSDVASKPVLISVASGKGGVGKSVLAANLGARLADLGHRVILADLDIGGPDLGRHLGCSQAATANPRWTHPSGNSFALDTTRVPGCSRLQLVRGLPDWADGGRLSERTRRQVGLALRNLPADVVVVDTGAGYHRDPLDFFLLGDLRLGVATPDPSAIADLSIFLTRALEREITRAAPGARATVAEAISQISSPSPDSLDLIQRISVGIGQPAKDRSQASRARSILRQWIEHPPILALNRVSDKPALWLGLLHRTLSALVGHAARGFTEIPDDPAVLESLTSAFLPVTVASPQAPASLAFCGLAASVEADIQDYVAHRRPRHASPTPLRHAARATA